MADIYSNYLSKLLPINNMIEYNDNEFMQSFINLLFNNWQYAKKQKQARSNDLVAPPVIADISSGYKYVISYTTYPIINVNTGTNTFTIDGNYTSVILAGEYFDISGSTINDGNYLIISSTLNAGDTDIVVASIIDATVDGSLLHTQGDWNDKKDYIAYSRIKEYRYYSAGWQTSVQVIYTYQEPVLYDTLYIVDNDYYIFYNGTSWERVFQNLAWYHNLFTYFIAHTKDILTCEERYLDDIADFINLNNDFEETLTGIRNNKRKLIENYPQFNEIQGTYDSFRLYLAYFFYTQIDIEYYYSDRKYRQFQTLTELGYATELLANNAGYYKTSHFKIIVDISETETFTVGSITYYNDIFSGGSISYEWLVNKVKELRANFEVFLGFVFSLNLNAWNMQDNGNTTITGELSTGDKHLIIMTVGQYYNIKKGDWGIYCKSGIDFGIERFNSDRLYYEKSGWDNNMQDLLSRHKVNNGDSYYYVPYGNKFSFTVV